jgi:hypothetical protein
VGADIHPYLEIKVNGKWNYIGLLWRDRNYQLFGLLSGVRGAEEPFGFPMPDEVPKDSSIKSEYDESGFHSITIIDYQDLQRFNNEHPGHYSEDWEKVMALFVKAFSCEARLVVGYDS